MNATYTLTVSQTHSAIERYTTDAVQKLQCKPGYEQRGAACQPKKSGGSVVGGLAKSALAGGLLGAAEGFYNSSPTGNNQQDATRLARRASATGAGALVSGGGLGRRLAGAATGLIASELASQGVNKYMESRRDPVIKGVLKGSAYEQGVVEYDPARAKARQTRQRRNQAEGAKREFNSNVENAKQQVLRNARNIAEEAKAIGKDIKAKAKQVASAFAK